MRTTARISGDTVRLMQQEAEDKFPDETGGILIGYWHSKAHVTIISMVGPGPNARHDRTGFEPDYDFHDAEVARAAEGRNAPGEMRRQDLFDGRPAGTRRQRKADDGRGSGGRKANGSVVRHDLNRGRDGRSS